MPAPGRRGHHVKVDDRIIDLERVAARHWRGTEEDQLGEWLLRAAQGFTGRANSALPLGDPGLPPDAAVDAVAGWYRARGLPPMIVLPVPLEGNSPARELDAYLSERAWATRSGPAFVMVADLPLSGMVTDLPLGGVPGDLPCAAEFLADPEPDDAWLATYAYRGTRQQPPTMRAVLTSAPVQAFTSIRSDRDVLAIARLSIAAGWAGLTAVEVHAGHRRAGLGTSIIAAACAEAAARGIRSAFLQVGVDNIAARSLYERCGFRYSHRYHYRVAPSGS
jgi:GNAT superfamily N-acetyltransferase